MSDLAIRIHVWATSTLAALRSEERGQDLIEYALWCGVIALSLTGLATFALFTDAISGMGAGIKNCADFTGTTTCDPF
jgi:Flp pilus assembly pilin Flp